MNARFFTIDFITAAGHCEHISKAVLGHTGVSIKDIVRALLEDSKNLGRVYSIMEIQGAKTLKEVERAAADERYLLDSGFKVVPVYFRNGVLSS